MPRDLMPHEETQTEHDVFSLEGLIAWLETQDPETEYVWADGSECVVGRYLSAVSPKDASVPWPKSRLELEEAAIPLLLFPGYAFRSKTYGAALARAKALQQNSG